MSTEEHVADQPKQSILKRQLGGSGKAKSTAPKAGKFGIPPRPQVNLMPPEILEGRHLAILKRRLVWAIAGLLVVVVVAFFGAYLLRVAAEDRYNESLEMSDTLTAQKRQYSPVIQVQKDITNTTNARTFALSTEVNWTDYVYQIQDVLPGGVTIETLQVVGVPPGEELPPGADDLTQPGVAVMTFTASSETLPDASEWIDALQSLPGLADVNLQSSVLQDEDGTSTYLVTVTVQVTEEALANRTFPDPQATAATEEDGN